MSEIRFNRWSHQSGTGGIYQDSSGNIGIGTSTPTSVLDIQGGSIKIGNDLLTSSGVSTFTSGLNVTGGNFLVGTTSAGGWLAKIQVADNATYQSAFNITNNVNADFQVEIKSSETRFGPSTNTPLVFKNGGGERLRITSSGNVAIGHNSPRSKLDVFETVSGNQTAIRIGNTNTPTSANDKRLEFVDGTGTSEGTNKYTYGYIQGYREGGSNSGALIFGTKPDNGSAPSEKLRITSAGNIGIGTNAPTTGNPSGAKYLHIHNSTANTYSPAEIYFTNANTGPSGGASSGGGMITLYGTGFYFWNYANDDILFGTGGSERFRFDHSETTLDLISSSKIRLQGSNNSGQRLAHINIGSDGGANSETRAIDIWGNWQDQESKSITYNHGSGANDMVAQARVRYNSAPSSTYYEIGRFYHGQNTTAFPVRFVSTSTTTANLELDGNLKPASGYGIDFSATSDAAGMTSELFDDYEEGSWTPTFNNAGTATYGVRVGRYVKVGNLVYATCHLDIASKNTASGNLVISGFPYTSVNVGNMYGVSSSVHGTGWTTARRSLNILLPQNSTTTNSIYHNMTATTSSSNPSITGSDWGFVSHDDLGTGNLLFSITYQAA